MTTVENECTCLGSSDITYKSWHGCQNSSDISYKSWHGCLTFQGWKDRKEGGQRKRGRQHFPRPRAPQPPTPTPRPRPCAELGCRLLCRSCSLRPTDSKADTYLTAFPHHAGRDQVAMCCSVCLTGTLHCPTNETLDICFEGLLPGASGVRGCLCA